MRYAGEYLLPATQLPYIPQGPAVWRIACRAAADSNTVLEPGQTQADVDAAAAAENLAAAVGHLLREPLERRSRGHAAAQAAAKLASGLVSTVWHVLDDVVVAPALGKFLEAEQQARRERSEQREQERRR
jgi:hypothetical protein